MITENEVFDCGDLTLIGIKDISFKANNGNEIKGVRLYFLLPVGFDDHIEGQGCSMQFLTGKSSKDFVVGGVYSPVYGHRLSSNGKIDVFVKDYVLQN